MKMYLFNVDNTKSTHSWLGQRTLRSQPFQIRKGLKISNHVVHAKNESAARRQLSRDFGMGRCPNGTKIVKVFQYIKL